MVCADPLPSHWTKTHISQIHLSETRCIANTTTVHNTVHYLSMFVDDTGNKWPVNLSLWTKTTTGNKLILQMRTVLLKAEKFMVVIVQEHINRVPKHFDTLEAVHVAPKKPAMASIAMYELAPVQQTSQAKFPSSDNTVKKINKKKKQIRPSTQLIQSLKV